MKKTTTLLLLSFLAGNGAFAQCWKMISTGYDHSYGIKADNSLWAWGRNNQGQLGDGSLASRPIPLPFDTSHSWRFVTAGFSCGFGIRMNGTLWAWGANLGGLGDGTLNSSLYPVQIGTDTDWVYVSSRGATLAIKSNGSLWAWGSNNNGELGDGTNQQRRSPVHIGTDTNWVSVKAGPAGHSLGIKSNGTAWAWGDGNDCKLGDGSCTGKLVPTQIGTGTNWTCIAAGANHSAGVKADGTLWTWGSNRYGQLGTDTSGGGLKEARPVQVGSDSNWAWVSAGEELTIALKTNGTLWGWGYNQYGGVGDGTINNKDQPTRVGTDTNWRFIDAYHWHGAAIKSDSTLWGWGRNEQYQLGDGTNFNRVHPVLVGCWPLSASALNKKTEQFVLSPNPANDYVSIRSTEKSLIELLSVYDITGRCLISRMGNTAELDVRQFSPGLYYVHISSGSRIHNLSFVKQ